MASTISAGTTSGTALNMAGDTSGSLQLQTNGTTTAVTIDTSQNVTLAGFLKTATLNAPSGVLANLNGMNGIVKAWVNFTGSTAVINGSFNVSSVTRTSTGIYQVNYTYAMPNPYYAASAGTSNDSTIRLDIYQTSTIRVVTNAATADPVNVSVAIFSS
jgi:hypothetical protein